MTKQGQTVVETVLLLPLVLFGIFTMLQALQLGIALIMVNYAAGSIARKAVRLTGDGNMVVQQFSQDYSKLILAGMHSETLWGCDETSPQEVTKDLIVVATARVNAFPVVGPMLNKLAPNFQESQSWTPACNTEPVPAFGFTGPTKYEFIVRGGAVARRNY